MNLPDLVVLADTLQSVRLSRRGALYLQVAPGKIVWPEPQGVPSAGQLYIPAGLGGAAPSRVVKRRGHILLCADGVFLMLLEVRHR